MDTPAIMSLFAVLIRDALIFFPDNENLRPASRKKQLFTFHFENEKKSMLLNLSEPLYGIVEKSCQARGIPVETALVLDGNRNQISSLHIPLSNVEGRCVYLSFPSTPTEVKNNKQGPELPRIKFPESKTSLYSHYHLVAPW